MSESLELVGRYSAPVGRLFLGGLFLGAGLSKIGDPGATAAMIESGGFPGILAWPVILFEIIAGAAIIAGIRARVVALALAVFCIFTGIFFHMIPGMSAEGQMAMLQQAMFMKNLAIAGGFLMIFTHGPGRYSVDHSYA